MSEKGGEIMTKQNAIIVSLLMFVIGGGAGFFAGTSYQKQQEPSLEQGLTIREGGQGRQQGVVRSGGNVAKGGFQPVNGEIVSMDDTSITVIMEDGGSKIIL